MPNGEENSEDWFTSPIRTIVREPLFQRQLEEMGINHRRIDHVMSGIEYGLAKHPEMFEKIPGGRDCMITTNFYPNAPAIRLLSPYSPPELHLESIEVAE